MRALKHLGPLTAYATYIFIAGSSRSSAPPAGLSDKAAHFICFGLMVPLAAFAISYIAPRLSSLARIGVAVAVVSAVGALLEFWQMLLPWRSAELLDWVADTAGALLIGALGLLASWIRDRVPSRPVQG